jgi:hypothetical protein
LEKSLFVAGAPANLHCADKVGSPGFEKLKNVALVSIHGNNLANNGAKSRVNIPVDGKSIFQLLVGRTYSRLRRRSGFVAAKARAGALACQSQAAAARQQPRPTQLFHRLIPNPFDAAFA